MNLTLTLTMLLMSPDEREFAGERVTGVGHGGAEGNGRRHTGE